MSSDEDHRVGIEDPTRINQLDKIITSLTIDLNGYDLIFSEMKNLSHYQLGQAAAQIKTAEEYFDILRNNLGEEEMLDFLINLTDYANYHIDFGTQRVAETLKKYKQKLERYRKECMRKNIYDPHFVGRREELDFITSELENQKSSIRGVSICGQGGMGKTTLGNEICRRLWASSRHWQIVKVDLREKSTVTDLLKDTILELHEKCRDDSDQDILRYTKEEQMEKELTKCINDIINYRTILMLDNVDGIIDKHEMKFLQLLHRLLVKLKGRRCKVRMIITSRQKLLWGAGVNEMMKMEDNLNEVMKEVEVRKLERQHAIELIGKCTMKDQVSQMECEDLATLTECNPLAIRTVCSTLKNCCGQLNVSSMITVLKESRNRGKLVGLENCLQESFKRLDNKMQVCLVKFTLFKTTPFDLQAAMKILESDGDLESSGDRVKSAILMTKMSLFHLKSRHLIEIEDRSIQSEKSSSSTKPDIRHVLYSLHPLVFEFLREQRSNFHTEMIPAKIRYIEYFENEVEKIGKQRENNFLEAAAYMRENSVHLQGYFEAVFETPDLPFSETRSDLVKSRRIMEVAKLLHDNERQLELLYKTANDAHASNKFNVWLYTQGTIIGKLVEVDKKSDIQGIIRETDIILEKSDLEKSSSNLIGALGNYYFNKGCYFWEVENKPQTLENLTKAQKVLESGTQTLRKNFRETLAAIYNQIGCYHYEYDLAECRKYHEKAIDVLSDESGMLINFPEVHTYRVNLAACVYKEGLDPNLDQASREEKWKEAKRHFSYAIQGEIRMYVDKTDDHAEKLKNRCHLYLNLKKHEKALQDAENCLQIRKEVLKEPHQKLTAAYGLVGRVFYHYGDQLMRDENSVEGMEKTEKSVPYFEKAMELIKNGGLSVGDDEYDTIKDFHIRAVKRVRHPRALEDVKQRYREIECPYDSSESEVNIDDSSESDIVLSSDGENTKEGIQTGELQDQGADIVQDVHTDSSQDTQTDNSQDTDTHSSQNEISTDGQTAKRWQEDRHDSGYSTSSALSTIGSTSSRKLSKERSFENLERPSLTSVSSGSFDDVFPQSSTCGKKKSISRERSTDIFVSDLLNKCNRRKRSAASLKRTQSTPTYKGAADLSQMTSRSLDSSGAESSTFNIPDSSHPVQSSPKVTSEQESTIPVKKAKVSHSDSKDRIESGFEEAPESSNS